MGASREAYEHAMDIAAERMDQEYLRSINADLLAALEDARETIRDHLPPSERVHIMRRINDALAKAKGAA